MCKKGKRNRRTGNQVIVRKKNEMKSKRKGSKRKERQAYRRKMKI